jgi:hypothetical protein
MLAQEPKPGSVAPIHSVVPIGGGDLVALSDSSRHSVVFFHAADGKLIAVTRTSSRSRTVDWLDPDSLVYEAGQPAGPGGALVDRPHEKGQTTS